MWLLTEVREDTILPGFHAHLTSASMRRRTRWAGVFSRTPLEPWPDPHPASAAARTAGLGVVSSVLPWRSCGSDPWGEGSVGEKTTRALAVLAGSLPDGPLVWGGDWNHALAGPERAGSGTGRAAIREALDRWHLAPATTHLPHALPGLSSIDHIALADHVGVTRAARVVAQDSRGRRLSDHDLYTVEADHVVSIPYCR